MSREIASLVVLGLGLCAACLYIRVLLARNRTLARAVAEHERRESQRTACCATVGHDLDQACVCRRCLTDWHNYTDIDTRRTPIRSGLVNPDADPGALHLDSNFQPDYDYGLTQTVYLCETTQRCARCDHEKTITSEVAVEDQR